MNSNVFLSDTRVYIAGILFPTIDVSISNFTNAVPTASITVPADSRLFNVGENDRVPVLVFQRETMVGSSRYILMFEGFILGRTYMNTALQRSVTFQAMGIMDILNDMRLLYMHSLNDMYRQMYIAENTGASTSANSYFTPKYFLQHGLDPSNSSIEYPFEYLDNVYRFMGRPTGTKADEEHNSHLAEYFWKMADLYRMQKRYLRVPLYDENTSGTTVWSGKKQNGFPILRGLQNSNAADLLSPFLATQTPSSQTAMDLIMTVANPMDFEMSMPSSPAYIDGSLGSSILKPNFCDSIPPMCNIMFRSQVTEISQTTVFKGTPTRVEVHDINSPDAWMRSKMNGSLQDYFEMLLTVFYPQRKVPGQEVLDKKYNNYATTILDSEIYTGPWVQEVNTPAWWLWTETLKHTDEGINEFGPEKAWVSCRQMMLHRQLVLSRYVNRTMSVHMAFNPYIAVGYPGVVFDAEDTSLSFAGYVVGVNHSISSGGMETTVELAFVRSLNEASEVQITHPIRDLQELLHDKDLMSKVYAGLLGDQAAAAAAIVNTASSAAQASSNNKSATTLPPNLPISKDNAEVLKRAREIANNNTWLYSQDYRGTVRNGNTYTDCSHFVAMAVLGMNEKQARAVNTDLTNPNNIENVLKAAGYEWHEGTSDLQPGDVLYKPRGWQGYAKQKSGTGHVEIYAGKSTKNGYSVTIGAHNDSYAAADQVSEKDYTDWYVTHGYKGVWRRKAGTQEHQSQEQVQQQAQSDPQATQQQNKLTPTPEEQNKIAEQQKKEIEEAQVQAATKAGTEPVNTEFNTSKPTQFAGAEARTFKEILDAYAEGTEDPNSPQRNPSAAFAMQRRNICSFDDFVSFAGLTPVRGVSTANEMVPVLLEGTYMSDRNTIKVYEKTRVEKAAENTDGYDRINMTDEAMKELLMGDVSETEKLEQAKAAEKSGTGETPKQEKPATTPGTGDDLGILSRKYESRGNSGAIGYDNRGGTSYGKYQIAAKTGTMNGFLKWCEKNGGENGKDIARRMRQTQLDTGSKTGSGPAEWQKLVAEGKMGTLEHDFIKATHYDVTMKNLSSGPRVVLSQYKTLQDVVWSTSNALGAEGARKAIEKAYAQVNNPNMTEEDLVKAIYAERDKWYDKNQYKAAVLNRHRHEERDALTMLKQEKETGSRALPANYDGGMGGEGAYSPSSAVTGDLMPIRSGCTSPDNYNPNDDYTLTEIRVGDSNYKVEEAPKDVRDILKAVAEDAFKKQIYA